MLRRRRMSITDTDAGVAYYANNNDKENVNVSLMTEANDILQLMIRLYKMNDKNEDTMERLQQQLVSMSTIISKQDDQLTNERKGFATVVSKLNKHYKKLETELKEMKDNQQLQTSSLDSKGSWEGSPTRSTCCSSSTHSTADMTHASSLYYGDDCSSTLDGGDASVTKGSLEESIEVWQERYDELVEKVTHLADENGDLLHKCNVLEEQQLALSHNMSVLPVSSKSLVGLQERKYKEALLSRIDSLQSENDELQIASIGMHNMMTTYENEIAGLNEQVEDAAVSKMEMERRIRMVEEQNGILRRKASYAAKRPRSLLENLDDIEEEMCDTPGTCHVDFLLRQGSIASRRRSIM